MMTSLPSAMPHQSALFYTVLRKPFTPQLLLRTVRACFAAHPRGNGGQPVLDRRPAAGEVPSQTAITDQDPRKDRSER
jgi:hypothetical protein